jgi:hypothetical protein
VLDDPGHFDLGCLGRLRRALGVVAVGDDGHGDIVCMGRAVCRQPELRRYEALMSGCGFAVSAIRTRQGRSDSAFPCFVRYECDRRALFLCLRGWQAVHSEVILLCFLWYGNKVMLPIGCPSNLGGCEFRRFLNPLYYRV